MIDGIKRRFTKSIDSDPWDADQELEPEVEEASELPTDTAAILAATKAATPSSNRVDVAEYYKGLVATAIENDGKYGEHRISIPWLRMISAGLDWRRIQPEDMWYGADAEVPGESPLAGRPAFKDLFPPEGDFPAGPGPR